MTRDKSKFIDLNKTKTETVIFGNDNRANIIGKGTVNLGTQKGREENVLLVEDMTHNLLSVSQICDHGPTCVFDSKGCEIVKQGTNKVVATTTRTPQNIYILDRVNQVKCCISKEDESWLWHRRLGHIKFENLVKISRSKVVREMPEITKPVNTMCKQCQHGKQTRMKFKTKEHSTTTFLELIHTDLCGPTKLKGFQGEKYLMLFIDDYTRMS